MSRINPELSQFYFVYFYKVGKNNLQSSKKELVDSEFRIGCWHVMKEIFKKCLQSFAHGMPIFFGFIEFQGDFGNVPTNIDLPH